MCFSSKKEENRGKGRLWGKGTVIFFDNMWILTLVKMAAISFRSAIFVKLSNHTATFGVIRNQEWDKICKHTKFFNWIYFSSRLYQAHNTSDPPPPLPAFKSVVYTVHTRILKHCFPLGEQSKIHWNTWAKFLIINIFIDMANLNHNARFCQYCPCTVQWDCCVRKDRHSLTDSIYSNNVYLLFNL